MFLNFLDELRAAGIPASIKEHLVLLEALDKDVIEQTRQKLKNAAQQAASQTAVRRADVARDLRRDGVRALGRVLCLRFSDGSSRRCPPAP